MSHANLWQGNFRELNAMVTRMATLASGGRIDLQTVRGEINRAGQNSIRCGGADDSVLLRLLGTDYAEWFDVFDLAQLERVVKVCRRSKNLADAGKNFAVSRSLKKSANDSDRLSKYLARFGLDFQTVVSAAVSR